MPSTDSEDGDLLAELPSSHPPLSASDIDHKRDRWTPLVETVQGTYPYATLEAGSKEMQHDLSTQGVGFTVGPMPAVEFLQTIMQPAAPLPELPKVEKDVWNSIPSHGVERNIYDPLRDAINSSPFLVGYRMAVVASKADKTSGLKIRPDVCTYETKEKDAKKLEGKLSKEEVLIWHSIESSVEIKPDDLQDWCKSEKEFNPKRFVE
ncbi:hypothetical protein K474DRAFT_1517494, partial [Panus rudis PR-1116 ss-1]